MMQLVIGVQKIATIRYHWQVRKLTYIIEVFEHYLLSRCAWHIALFLAWYRTQ